MRSIPSALALVSSLLSLGGLAAAQGGGEPPPTFTKDQMMEALKKALPFDVHGGVLLWYYQPLGLEGYEDDTQIYYANLVLDAASGNWGFHFEPRFRDSKLRPFFNSNTWIQELYVSWKPSADCTGMLKAGKVYSQFGRFWDGVFYGNIPYFDGLKLDPDLGVSWEQKVALNDRTNVDYSLQYFTRDGETNGSLQGRDTLSIGTERDAFVGRVAPTIALGDSTSLTVGVSGMAFKADLPTPAAESDVTRANLEASLDVGKFTAFADYTHQSGNHVVDFPLPGSSSDDIDYLMSGLQYQWDDLTLRYSYSSADYKDEDVQEWLHLPGIVYQINPHVSLWLEYVYWGREEPLDDFIVDRSLNLILYAAF